MQALGTLGKTLPGSHMSQQNLVEIAKQGDARAISQLINRSLNPKGINAKTILREGCLKVMVEASPVPGRGVADYIYRGIVGLDIPEIDYLIVYGRQPGDEFPVWTEEFNLDVFGELASQSVIPESIPSESDICCPRCQSSQVMVSKKGFDVGSAAVGALLFGSVGLAGGMIGSNEVMLSCIKCGYQWQPGEKPAKISLDRSTSTRLKKPTPISRIGNAVLTFFVLGIMGLILFLIPVIGWVLGAICLFLAICTPISFLFGDDNSLTNLVGDCPHCKKSVEVQHEKTEFKCLHCQGEIVVKSQRFYAVER